MLRKHALSLVEGPSAFLALPSETPYSQRAPFATSPGAAPLDGLFEHPVSLFKQGMEILQVQSSGGRGFQQLAKQQSVAIAYFRREEIFQTKFLLY